MDSIHTWSMNGFDEVQRRLEAAASELKTATDPNRRRTLLKEMSRLIGPTRRTANPSNARVAGQDKYAPLPEKVVNAN
jgi:hypothetical protein